MEANSKVQQEDIENLAKEKIFNELNNKTILITGASGLLGSELVLSLICANRLKNLNIKVVGLVRNLEKAKEKFKNILNNKNLTLISQDIKDEITTNEKPDYIIHLANITSSKLMVQKPIETSLTTIIGVKNILDFALLKDVKSFVYVSSLEIYGKINKDEIFEDDYGIIDSISPRSSYPLSKKCAENLCIAYSLEKNLNVKIARLTQTFGAGLDKEDNRIYANGKSCSKKRRYNSSYKR